jgi:hypothetical protein
MRVNSCRAIKPSASHEELYFLHSLNVTVFTRPRAIPDLATASAATTASLNAVCFWQYSRSLLHSSRTSCFAGDIAVFSGGEPREALSALLQSSRSTRQNRLRALFRKVGPYDNRLFRQNSLKKGRRAWWPMWPRSEFAIWISVRPPDADASPIQDQDASCGPGA